MSISVEMPIRKFGVPLLASIIGLGVSAVQLYEQTLGTNAVIVASSPADALIEVNGKAVGKTPATLELKRGTYTLVAKRKGYEPTQHAIYVSEKGPNLVNLQLLPQQTPVAESEIVYLQAPKKDRQLLAEVEALKAALIKNPEEALSLPLLRERLRVQEELSKALREDLKEVKEQSKWYLGSMIAIVVGLLGVIATLFVGQRSKP